MSFIGGFTVYVCNSISTHVPPLVLKARAPNDGSTFCIGFSRLEVPEQTLGGIPLGLGMVMKINFFEFSCTTCTCTCTMLCILYTACTYNVRIM